MKKREYSSPKADIVNLSAEEIMVNSYDNDAEWDDMWSGI